MTPIGCLGQVLKGQGNIGLLYQKLFPTYNSITHKPFALKLNDISISIGHTLYAKAVSGNSCALGPQTAHAHWYWLEDDSY
jgi:hypothetical protein